MSPLDFFLQSATKIGGFKFLPSIGGVQIKSEDNLLVNSLLGFGNPDETHFLVF